MTIDSEFLQDLILEQDWPDTFGQLDPASIKSVTPCFGDPEITDEEVGFALEHNQLLRWAMVVSTGYRNQLRSDTPFISRLTLSQTEAVISTLDYGSFVSFKFLYPAAPINLKVNETIVLHLRSSDLIELLFSQGALKSFRYSRSQKTLRAYAELFERPLLLHKPNPYRDRAQPNFDIAGTGSITLNPLELYQMVSLCNSFMVANDGREEAGPFIQVSAGTLRMHNDEPLVFFRSSSIDEHLEFKLPERSVDIFSAVLKEMATARFMVDDNFNTISDGVTAIGWEIVKRQDLHVEYPRRDEQGELLILTAEIVSALRRINGLLPECAAIFAIREVPKGGKAKTTHSLEITARTPDGKNYRRLIDGTNFSFSERAETVYPVTFSIKPREVLTALTNPAANVELSIEQRVVRVTLDEGAHGHKSEVIVRNLSDKQRVGDLQ
jgi:hypothetical protein